MLHKTYVSYIVSPSEIEGHITMVAYVPYCRIGCPYCYNKGLLDIREGNYTIQDIIGAIVNRNMKYNLITAISITGGEVLYNQNKIIEDLKIFRKELPDILVNIDTCLLPAIIDDQLIELVDTFRISVKALSEIPNPKMRHNAITNLQKIVAIKHKPVEYRVVLTSENTESMKTSLETMFDYMAFATTLGIYVDKAILTEENMGCFSPATDNDIQEIKDYICERICSSGQIISSLYS